MTDILEMLDDLRELQSLYKNDELRSVDFQTKISKYKQQFDQFEQQMEFEFANENR